jgi:TPR repeat protein
MARMVRWDELEDSASAGDEVAAFELAMRLASGSGGIAVNLVQAHRWFNVSAALGYAPAGAWRSEIAADMSARDVNEAQKLARATIAGRMRAA